MLGLSEWAIRGRIQRRTLSADFTDGQWRIPISMLPEDNQKGGISSGISGGVPEVTGGTRGASDGMDTASLIDARQQAQADSVLQRILAPFIEQLTLTIQELGRLRAERGAAIADRDRLQTAYDAIQTSIKNTLKGHKYRWNRKPPSRELSGYHADSGSVYVVQVDPTQLRGGVRGETNTGSRRCIGTRTNKLCTLW